MSTVSQAFANQVADALLVELRKIGAATDAGAWLSSPRVVRRGLLAADVQGETPALLVQVARWSDELYAAGGRHRTRITIFVHCLSDPGDPEAAEIELNNLAADVIRAVSDNHTLGGVAEDVSVTYYEPNVDAMDRTGLGVATVNLDAAVTWQHGSP